jgi:hypothetical protein
MYGSGPSLQQSSTSSQTFDTTSGQDAAYKAAQERSALQAQNQASLYNGNIPDLLASTNRIRDLQKYLSAYGTDPNGFEVIPKTRLAGMQEQQHSTSFSPGFPIGAID